MSTLFLPVYKDEAGVHSNPATMQMFQTDCNSGSVEKKKFKEVLIHWNSGLNTWIEDSVFVPGQSIVALRVDNPCTGNFSYLNYAINDFRIKSYCCVNEVNLDDIFVDAFATAFV